MQRKKSAGKNVSTNKKTNTVGRKSGVSGKKTSPEGSRAGSSGSKPRTGNNSRTGKTSVKQTTTGNSSSKNRGGTKPLNDVSAPRKRTNTGNNVTRVSSRREGFSTRGAKSQTINTDSTKGNMFTDENDTDISTLDEKVI